jgi:hypothetical protein
MLATKIGVAIKDLAGTHFALSEKQKIPANENGAFKAMKTRTVIAIIQPYQDGVPLHPSVAREERITRAIELMVKFNVKCIAVTRGGRPIGLIRLTDAFRELGLKESEK